MNEISTSETPSCAIEPAGVINLKLRFAGRILILFAFAMSAPIKEQRAPVSGLLSMENFEFLFLVQEISTRILSNFYLSSILT